MGRDTLENLLVAKTVGQQIVNVWENAIKNSWMGFFLKILKDT